MKTGLIMEGGAMRGMFTCGVLDVFLDSGVTFDGAAGISAGAVFGCNFKSRQMGRALRYNLRYGSDPRYCSLRSLLRTGDLYGADFCYRELPDRLDVFDREAFRANPMEFYVGATEVKTGKPVFHLCRDGGERDMLWMRASASMPLVSRPVTIGDRSFLDGGITDAIPYRVMEQVGYDRNVIILTRPLGYEKKPFRGGPAARLLLTPAVAKAMERRHRMYNRQLAEVRAREESGACLVIRPTADLAIRRTESDPAELQRVYDLGRQAGETRLAEVRDFLSGKE